MLVFVSLFDMSHIRPLDPQGAQRRQGRQNHADDPHIRQGLIIFPLDDGQIRSRHRVSQARRSDVQDEIGIQVRQGPPQRRGQAVEVDVLADGDEDGAREGLEEGDDGGADSDVLLREHGRRAHERQVHGEADAEAVDQLVADLRGRGGVDAPRGHEPRADGGENRGQVEEGGVVA